jgi:hypothetical protein
MVATNLSPPQGGMASTPHHEGSSSNVVIFMCDQTVNLQTRAKNYDILDPSHIVTEAASSSHPSGHIQIVKPSFDASLRPPNGVLQRTTHNPNTRVAHNYIIVEDLAHAQCAMSALEVL